MYDISEHPAVAQVCNLYTNDSDTAFIKYL